MTQEDKQLLLKDLCARLPYSLYIRVEEFNVPENDGRITEGFIGNYLKDNRCNDYDAEGILNELADGCINVKPYLRPMSSMTEEEFEDLKSYSGLKYEQLYLASHQNGTYKCLDFYLNEIPSDVVVLVFDWLNKNMFDYRGLIPMGLALEASEGMYKNRITMAKVIEIPEGYEAKIEGNKVIFELKEQKPADKLALENPLTGEKVYEREIPEFMKGPDPKDVEAIIHLTTKGWTVIAPGKEQKSVEWSKEYREEDLRTRFAFYTYKDEDGVLYLSNIFVEEASRNAGFGTRILNAAEMVAKTIGATTIRLRVKQDSPVNAWYRKNGYGYITFEKGYDWLEKNLEYMKPSKPVDGS